MKNFVILLFCLMVNHLVNGQTLSGVQLFGVVYDATTNQPLIAKVSIFNSENGKISELNSIETQPNGNFKLDLLKKDIILKIKVKGYLISSVKMDFLQVKWPFFYCEIPLIKEDSQQLDQIYLQSTTKNEYSVNDTKEAKNAKSIHVFQAVDGVDNKVVAANFKLVSTQNNKENIYETTIEKPSFEINFSQKDIVAIEVTKDNYQKFLGNLIIETIDNKTHQNSARLIRRLSFLNIVNKTNFTDMSLTKIEPIESLISLKENNKILFGILNVNAKYRVTLNNKTSKPIIKEFIAQEGINQIILETDIVENVTETIEKHHEIENQVLYFEQTTVTIKEESKILLEEVLKKMKMNPDLKIEIIGHTDNVGDYYQNQYLSEFRAKYIANFLFNKGIKDNRISIKGDGSAKPIIENNTEENRSKNRRVEIKLY
jgi:outer membrane protein OmpA-like peptidoglycan-associated protein